MIPQYTAASIASQNKLATPSSVDSIVSSNGQEDHVMGANGATKALRVMDNLERILAIELMNASQAIEYRRLQSCHLSKCFELV
jgi:histidine ammonia-lyase